MARLKFGPFSPNITIGEHTMLQFRRDPMSETRWLGY